MQKNFVDMKSKKQSEFKHHMAKTHVSKSINLENITRNDEKKKS